jgi:hypothetical protein
MCSQVFILWFLGHHFAQPRGQAKRSRAVFGVGCKALFGNDQ